jgi:hypothetical protein
MTLWIDVACLAWVSADTGFGAFRRNSCRRRAYYPLKSYLQKRIRQIRRGIEENS